MLPFLCSLLPYLQMIGSLPVLVNPASLTGVSSTHSPPTQGLQVQTVAPQLLLNSQGQIIATIASNLGATAFTTSTSSTILNKTTLSHTKLNTQVWHSKLLLPKFFYKICSCI